MPNTGVFIDYDNIYDIIEEKYNDKKTIEIHITFIEKLWNEVKDDSITKFIAFADFSKIKKDNLITELQKRGVKLEHCYSNGLIEDYRKNASDLSLCISVIKSLYELDIDKYIIVSSDCDMIPILNELKFRQKETMHIFSRTASNKDIKEYNINDKWAVVSSTKLIEDILGIPEYKKIESPDEETFKLYLTKILPIIFTNLKSKYDKYNSKTEYGFGYIKEDISKALSIVKADAGVIAEELKQKNIIIKKDELVGGKYENFRLNKNNDYVKEILFEEINKPENSEIFLN